MPTTLHANPATWQGLAVRAMCDWQERPLSHAATVVTEELKRLGKKAPATILLAEMHRHGHEDAEGLLLDALCDAPYAFVVSPL